MLLDALMFKKIKKYYFNIFFNKNILKNNIHRVNKNTLDKYHLY